VNPRSRNPRLYISGPLRNATRSPFRRVICPLVTDDDGRVACDNRERRDIFPNNGPRRDASSPANVDAREYCGIRAYDCSLAHACPIFSYTVEQRGVRFDFRFCINTNIRTHISTNPDSYTIRQNNTSRRVSMIQDLATVADYCGWMYPRRPRYLGSLRRRDVLHFAV
jgi:hypothetical protein